MDMDNNEIRDMLAFIDRHLNTASDCLFVAQLSFEKIHAGIFESTLKSLREVIRDIGDARSLMFDYLNRVDFPNHSLDPTGADQPLPGKSE